MRKPTTYFLVARDKKTNTIKFITVSGGWGDSLEDIDLFTINYESAKELIDYLYKMEEIKTKNVDLFILNRVNSKDSSEINIQEILYSDSESIKKVAWGFKSKDLSSCSKEIDNILNKFCYLMENNPDFNDFVIYDENNIYDKFVNYFTDSKYSSNYDLKYRDGAWARKSYYLLRNICETISRYSKNNVNYKDLVDRNQAKEELLRMTTTDYDENQICFFDMNFSSMKTDEDKLLEVMNTFEGMDDDTITEIDGEIVINENMFIIDNESDKEKFLNLLDSEIVCLVKYFKTYKSKINDINFDENYKYYYEDLISTCKKSIIFGLEDSETLNNAYLWCLLYNKYNDKRLGDMHGYGYRKD